MDSIETDRLLLRPFTSADGSNLHSIMGNDSDMTWEGEAWSYEKTLEWLWIRLDHYKEHRYGVWAVVDRSSGDMIGQTGLQVLKEANEVELVTYTAKRWWRKGIGFEACTASLIYGFSELKLPKIIAVTRVFNKAGQGLVEKLGFQHMGEGWVYGVKVFFYRLLSDEFIPKLHYYRVIHNI